MRTLLQQAANPDASLQGYGSALVLAVRANDIELVRTLLAAGADPRKRSVSFGPASCVRVSALDEAAGKLPIKMLLMRRAAALNTKDLQKRRSDPAKYQW